MDGAWLVARRALLPHFHVDVVQLEAALSLAPETRGLSELLSPRSSRVHVHEPRSSCQSNSVPPSLSGEGDGLASRRRGLGGAGVQLAVARAPLLSAWALLRAWVEESEARTGGVL